MGRRRCASSGQHGSAQACSRQLPTAPWVVSEPLGAGQDERRRLHSVVEALRADFNESEEAEARAERQPCEPEGVDQTR